MRAVFGEERTKEPHHRPYRSHRGPVEVRVCPATLPPVVVAIGSISDKLIADKISRVESATVGRTY